MESNYFINFGTTNPNLNLNNGFLDINSGKTKPKPNLNNGPIDINSGITNPNFNNGPIDINSDITNPNLNNGPIDVNSGITNPNLNNRPIDDTFGITNPNLNNGPIDINSGITNPNFYNLYDGPIDINSDINSGITNFNHNDGHVSTHRKIDGSTVETLFTNIPDLKTIRDNISEYLETVKVLQQYFNLKDYNEIFNNPKLRNVYLLRYTPHRAHCYFLKLFGLKGLLRSLFTHQDYQLQILCLGAGAGAEVVAISLAYRYMKKKSQEETVRKPILHIRDKYDYEPFLKDLFEQMNTKGMDIAWNFMKGDIIGIGPHETGDAGDGLGGETWDLILGGKIELITACFVANELFATNVKRAERFFVRLTQAMPPNTLLLILDLPSTNELSFHDNINLWTYLENLERTISSDNFKDQILLVDRISGSKFDANKYLDKKYYHTVCHYDYFLFKKERIYKY